MSELLTIGQFSRMCWLSVKALRLYDETGLLAPARVDRFTGYRYYAAGQAPVARAIAILRSLDMPLPEIRQLLAESDIDHVRARLDAHRVVLEDRIERHRHMLRRVEDFIRKGAIMAYDITTKTIEPVEVVGTTTTVPPERVGPESRALYDRIYAGLGEAGINPAGRPRLVYHDLGGDAWRIECCVPVSAGSPTPGGLTRRTMAGGRAAVTRHIGPYEELGMAYREVEVWMQRQRLTSAGPPYDIYVNDMAEVRDPSKFETDIVWPVS